MKLTLDIPTETVVGLRRLANDVSLDLEAAAAVAIRELLVMGGYIDVEPEIDEASETSGEA